MYGKNEYATQKIVTSFIYYNLDSNMKLVCHLFWQFAVNTGNIGYFK